MNRSFERVVAFAGDFSPLLALHALIPTLAAAAGREPRLSIALPLSMNMLEKHFMFSRQALREGRWWTTASYILLHANQAHALSNLQSILVAGPAATETLGVNGAMLTYVAAGVAGALDPFDFGTQRLERIVERWGIGERVRRALDSVTGSVEAGNVWDKLSNAFDKTRKSAVRAVAQQVNENVRSIGASAGVSAFVAIDTCVVAEALLLGRRCDANAVLHVVSSVFYFAHEWRLIDAQDNIGHGAHLTGAAGGGGALVLCRFLRRRSRRWRDYGHGYSGRAPSSPTA
jgi:membrane associated rhomboid family serine protease